MGHSSLAMQTILNKGRYLIVSSPQPTLEQSSKSPLEVKRWFKVVEKLTGVKMLRSSQARKENE